MIVSNADRQCCGIAVERDGLRRSESKGEPSRARRVIPELQNRLLGTLRDQMPGLDPAFPVQSGFGIENWVEVVSCSVKAEPAPQSIEPRHARIVRSLSRVTTDGVQQSRGAKYVPSLPLEAQDNSAKLRAKRRLPAIVFEPQSTSPVVRVSRTGRAPVMERCQERAKGRVW